MFVALDSLICVGRELVGYLVLRTCPVMTCTDTLFETRRLTCGPGEQRTKSRRYESWNQAAKRGRDRDQV